MVNERDNETNDLVQPQPSFFRRYRGVLLVVLAFVLLVGWVLYHHHQQQLLAQAQGAGAGAGRGGRGGGGMGGGTGGGSGGRGGRGAGGAGGPVAVTVATVSSGDIAVRIGKLNAVIAAFAIFCPTRATWARSSGVMSRMLRAAAFGITSV